MYGVRLLQLCLSGKETVKTGNRLHEKECPGKQEKKIKRT